MLKKHAQFFESLFIISDVIVVSVAWTLSYFLKFYSVPALVSKIPSFLNYLEFLFPLWITWGLVSRWAHLYHPRRIEHFSKEFSDIIKVVTSTTILLIAIVYLFKRVEISQWSFFYFWFLDILGLLSTRFLIRRMLRILRRRGYNKRSALIAGTGDIGRKILEKVEGYQELGIHAIGFLTHDTQEVGKRIKGIPILGVYEDTEKIVLEKRPDIFFVGLPINEYDCLEGLLRVLRVHIADIKVIPGAYKFMSLRGGVDELDDLPIVSLQSSPLYGWNSVFKRIFDLFFGGLVLVIVSPFLLVISLLVKGTSKGPILYRQERVGMDGHPFQILKFRTMKVNAEEEIGPVWAKEDDPRRTRVGTFLRRMSLDEFPQLFNVLMGQMSLVGPRPERPNFVEEFRSRIPQYLLRHKIKAGMTGWAQVNGWRGNTSLEKRIEHDLYYIQNWSIGFDLRILSMTFWRGFFNRSAY